MTEFKNYRDMKSLKQINAERKEKQRKESEIVQQKFDKLLAMNPLNDVFRSDMIIKVVNNEKNKGHSNDRIIEFLVDFLEYPEKEVKQIISEVENDRKESGNCR